MHDVALFRCVGEHFYVFIPRVRVEEGFGFIFDVTAERGESHSQIPFALFTDGCDFAELFGDGSQSSS